MSEMSGEPPLPPARGQPGPGGPAIAVVDAEGNVAGWTEAAERAVGYRADEVVGHSGAMLLVNPGTVTEFALWASRRDAHDPWSGVVQIRRKDASVVKLMVDVAAIIDGSDVSGFLVVARGPSLSYFWEPERSAVGEALPARSPIGLSLWDTDLRCIWMNSAAEQQDDEPRGKRMGTPITEMLTGAAGADIAAGVRQVLETGEPIIDREYSWQTTEGEGEEPRKGKGERKAEGERKGEGKERVLSASYTRLDGTDGKPIGVVGMATDLDKSLARQHLFLLGQVGPRIGTTLDVSTTAQEFADAVVPLLADYATVDLADAVPLGEEPLQHFPASEAGIPAFRRAAMATLHIERSDVLWQTGEVVFVPPDSPYTRPLLSGRSHFEPVLDTSPGSWLDRDPVRAASVARTGVHSMIVVPLQARGTILGEVVLVRTDNKAAFTREDLLLVEELAGRTALSLDNARRYNRERAASIALQRTLLPKRVSGGRAVEAASRYKPAGTHLSAGGDWFDVIPLARERVGLAVGDVVGHGLDAAALMGQHRTTMRTLADLDLPPAELLAQLDRLVSFPPGSDGNADLDAPGMNCTCLYAVYDPATGICDVATAGHPPPAVLLPDGSVTFADTHPGAPIGLGTMVYTSVSLVLPENSVLALYTDGLIETRTADIDEGMDRLAAALAQPADSLEDLATRVLDTMTGGPSTPGTGLRGRSAPGAPAPAAYSEDDIALLLARTRRLEERGTS